MLLCALLFRLLSVVINRFSPTTILDFDIHNSDCLLFNYYVKCKCVISESVSQEGDKFFFNKLRRNFLIVF